MTHYRLVGKMRREYRLHGKFAHREKGAIIEYDDYCGQCTPVEMARCSFMHMFSLIKSKQSILKVQVEGCVEVDCQVF
jgi:hypothetical protein